MSRYIYATTLECDGCGAREQVGPAPDGKDIYDLSLPAGWSTPGGHARHPGMEFMIRDHDNRVYQEFCPDCISLPLSELLKMIGDKRNAVPDV